MYSSCSLYYYRADLESEGEGEHGEVGVGELMTNIFGEDSDDEKEDKDTVKAQYQVGFFL